MDSPTHISVLICTFNRAQSLKRTLESVVTQSAPQGAGWEIIVVDNNSSDETREVVEDFRRRCPERVRYVFEAQQGVSHARNTGVGEARGEIVAFIDDDEIADVNWLQNLTANLLSGEWAGAGGCVQPQWDGPCPSWLTYMHPFLLGPLAMFDHGPDAMQLSDPPFGANMAFRKEMFAKYGAFRTDLGRVGKSMLSGEDTEFGERLIDAGERLRYEPSAITLHPVKKHRATRKYFLLWWFNKGRSDARHGWNLASRKMVFGIPFRLLRNIAVEAVRWTFATDPSSRFVCHLKVWAYAGQAWEGYRQSFAAKRKGSLLDSKVLS